MPQFRFLAALLFAGALACSASEASASVLIQIDKRAQTMTVAVDGQLRYRWPVSTGATGFSTPVGSYTPFRMEVMHYSREWDNAGMPHAIFFTTRGHSIHGSDHPGLGTPSPTVASASHCQTPPRSISSSSERHVANQSRGQRA
jgi:hypothetical protein